MENTYENTGVIYFKIYFLMQWLVQMTNSAGSYSCIGRSAFSNRQFGSGIYITLLMISSKLCHIQKYSSEEYNVSVSPHT
jgi:hypothetical protein